MKSGIIYEGPSLIDGSPIVAIATLSGANRKTGGAVQTYILRADVAPLEASKTGADVSICGACPLRGTPTDDPARKQAKDRRCYVNLGQGPMTVYKAFSRGAYADARGHAKTAEIGTGRFVRLGTYGDPAAVPSYVWDSLLSRAESHTAYTHQSSAPGADARPDIMMISADNEADARNAWANGARTFRVVNSVGDVIKGAEILCPASKEAGARVQCNACRLCGGAAVRAKSVAIVDHGPVARAKRRRAA